MAAGKPKNGMTKTGSDDQALKYIRNLDKIENDAKEPGLTGEDPLHCIWIHLTLQAPLYRACRGVVY